MKSFIDYLVEAAQHEELKKRIVSHMRNRYSEVAADLPREGNHHYNSAHDHLRDNAHDEFHRHPDFSRKHHNLSALATKALKHYATDDRAESRHNDAKHEKRREKQWVRNDQPPRPPKRAMKKKKTWWHEMGYAKKPKKGIGSY